MRDQTRERKGACLSPLQLLKQNTTDWVAFINNTFISHSSGGWKSKVKPPTDLVSDESPLAGSYMAVLSLCPQVVEEAWELSGVSFIRA